MRTALVVAVLLLGCHSSNPPLPVSNVATGPLPAPPPAPPPVLELGQLTVTFDGQPIAHVHADGRTELVRHGNPRDPMEPGSTFHADGTITSQWGKQYLRVDANGDIYMLMSRDDVVVAHATPERLTFTFGDPVPIRLVRNVLLLPGGADRSRVVGAKTPGLRRTILVVTAVNYLMGTWPATSW